MLNEKSIKKCLNILLAMLLLTAACYAQSLPKSEPQPSAPLSDKQPVEIVQQGLTLACENLRDIFLKADATIKTKDAELVQAAKVNAELQNKISVLERQKKTAEDNAAHWQELYEKEQKDSALYKAKYEDAAKEIRGLKRRAAIWKNIGKGLAIGLAVAILK